MTNETFLITLFLIVIIFINILMLPKKKKLFVRVSSIRKNSTRLKLFGSETTTYKVRKGSFVFKQNDKVKILYLNFKIKNKDYLILLEAFEEGRNVNICYSKRWPLKDCIHSCSL